jgi:thioredoxin 1
VRPGRENFKKELIVRTTGLLLVIITLLPFCGGPKNTPAKPAPETLSTPAPETLPPVPAAAETGKTQPPPVPEKAGGTKPPPLPKLWDFFATWCPPCKQQAPIIEELAAEYQGKIEIVSIDTDKNPDLARKFNIQAIPTLVFLAPSGRELSRHIGFFPKDSIIARFKQHQFIE